MATCGSGGIPGSSRFSDAGTRRAQSDPRQRRYALAWSTAGLAARQSGVSIEVAALGRRAKRRSSSGAGRDLLAVEVGENLLDHHRILDTDDDPHGTTAGDAGFDVDVEHPFVAVRLREERSTDRMSYSQATHATGAPA